VQTLTNIFEIDQDSTFEFERKRNRPERYDRNMTEQTLKAIPLITKIRHERLKKHITDRFILVLQFVVCWIVKGFSCLICDANFDRHKPGKKKELERDNKELEQDINMLPKKLISNEAAEKTKVKVKVKVVQQQTEDRMEE
jgi:large subunit ribosomal protein L24e